MDIQDKTLDEFIDIYEGSTGERLERSEASHLLRKLLQLYRLLLSPLPPDDGPQEAPLEAPLGEV